MQNHPYTRRLIDLYTIILSSVAVGFGILHMLCRSFEAGGVHWVDLDKERNLPTWFSGLLLLAMGLAALLAWRVELHQRQRHDAEFRHPILWLPFAALCFFFCLDETTILHENLFWREVRQVSVELGGPWQYLTQWQLMLAPAIVLVIIWMVLFFANRYRLSQGALATAIAGLGCWIIALALESIRGILLVDGKGLNYQTEVLVEELAEMIGAILLLAALARYIADIALDFSAERRELLTSAPRLLNRRALILLSTTLAALAAIGIGAYTVASHQARQDAPVPSLIKKATDGD